MPSKNVKDFVAVNTLNLNSDSILSVSSNELKRLNGANSTLLISNISGSNISGENIYVTNFNGTVLANQISNSTSAGRTLLTSSTQGQRDALSIFPSYSSYQDLVLNGPQQTSRVYVTTNDWRTYSWVPSVSQYIEVSPSVSSISSGVGISSGVNGNFSNIAGLTKNAAPEWWDGVPVGWSGVNTTFTVYSGLGTNNYVANIGQLSSGPSGNSFRQNLGRLPITSNVELTFTYSEPFGDAALNAAIYNGTYGNLAAGEYTAPGTYTLTGNSIPANTNIIIGFWSPNPGVVNPALDNVSVSQTTPATTWIFPTGLPRNNDNLPLGALWVDTSAGNTLKIVL